MKNAWYGLIHSFISVPARIPSIIPSYIWIPVEYNNSIAWKMLIYCQNMSQQSTSRCCCTQPIGAFYHIWEYWFKKRYIVDSMRPRACILHKASLEMIYGFFAKQNVSLCRLNTLIVMKNVDMSRGCSKLFANCGKTWQCCTILFLYVYVIAKYLTDFSRK